MDNSKAIKIFIYSEENGQIRFHKENLNPEFNGHMISDLIDFWISSLRKNLKNRQYELLKYTTEGATQILMSKVVQKKWCKKSDAKKVMPLVRPNI